MKKIFLIICCFSICLAVHAQSKSRALPTSEQKVLNKVIVSNRIDRSITLSSDHIIKLFEPLAIKNFAFKEAEIIEQENQLYLIANFENSSTQEGQAIGILLIRENDSLIINRTVQVAKCAVTESLCNCNPFYCTCSKDGYQVDCGPLEIVEQSQMVNFYKVIDSISTRPRN